MSRRHDGHPVRAVRNDDLGACGAFVTYEALARLVEEQFHPQIAGELFKDCGVNWNGPRCPPWPAGRGFVSAAMIARTGTPLPVPGRIATTGTLRDPAFASEQCSERATCEALRPADAQPMGMPCPSP